MIIGFNDVFGDQAFQRWNDIHKVGVDSLVSYLVMASMVKTPRNAWFGLKLRKLIAEHLDQEKCYELVGYPSGFKKKGTSQSINNVNNVVPDKVLANTSPFAHPNGTVWQQCQKVFNTSLTPKTKFSPVPKQAQSSQGEPKVQKYYNAEYKKMKAKLALLEACPPTSQSSKPFQLKNKGLVAETLDWDEEEETRVQVLMALADDELSVGKNHIRNGE
ncbi:hypothetical protein Tco_1103442 [Tanacetum coccineum]